MVPALRLRLPTCTKDSDPRWLRDLLAPCRGRAGWVRETQSHRAHQHTLCRLPRQWRHAAGQTEQPVSEWVNPLDRRLSRSGHAVGPGIKRFHAWNSRGLHPAVEFQRPAGGRPWHGDRHRLRRQQGRWLACHHPNRSASRRIYEVGQRFERPGGESIFGSGAGWCVIAPHRVAWTVASSVSAIQRRESGHCQPRLLDLSLHAAQGDPALRAVDGSCRLHPEQRNRRH